MKTKLNNWFDWIVCGYREKTGTHSMFCGGWRFGMNTLRGRLAAKAFEFVRNVPRQPLYFRHRLADKLAWASISLRQCKLARFGYYEDEFGNEAAKLVDRIAFELIIATDLHDKEAVGRMNQIQDMVGELGSLKGAVSWNDYKLALKLDGKETDQ